MVSPNLLRSFVAVARSSSITRAAETLNLTQPTVTGHIKALETQLAAPLFHRSARGVQMTAIGEDLLRDVSGHLEAVEQAFERLRARSSQIKGVIRFGGPAEFLDARMAPVFAKLSQSGLDLRIVLGGRERIRNAFDANTVDLGILASDPQSTHLGYQPIFQEKLLCVASPSVARTLQRDGLNSASFPSLDFVTYDETLPLVRTYGIAVFGVSIEASAKITVPNLSLIKRVLAQGTGVSVLPHYLCVEELATGALVEVHQPKRVPINQLFLVWRKDALRLPRVVRAREICLQALSSGNT